MHINKREKTIVLINTVLYGSTGNIVRQLKTLAEDNGMKAYTVSAYSRKNTMKYGDNDIVIGHYIDRYLHIWLSRVTGLSGSFSVISTLELICKLKRIKPDVIHLHNLHNAYINLPILFRYIKKNDVKVIWTLHDCWAFTGRCPHFDMLGCEKWKTGCSNCPYPPEFYPVSNRDESGMMWRIKKASFTGVKDMTLVTPSEWLAGLARESFLKEYPVITINNGIDLEIFRPIKNHIFEEITASGKHIVLGLAMDWNKRKGLDVMIEVSKRLSNKYQILMVGTDNKLAEQLSKYNIKCINRTGSQQELAEIYTASDVFINPTREDNFPTVNLEALACGTPVITFDTGGSPESLDETCGIVVPKEDIDEIVNSIIRICEKKEFSSSACIERAHKYDKYEKFTEYIKLY